jgi:hypothetical protein
VKPRLVAVHAVGWGLGLVRQRFSAGRKACWEPARWRHPYLVRGLGCRARLREMGRTLRTRSSSVRAGSDGGAKATPESEASDARKRTLAALVCTGVGAQAVRRSCSRVVLVAEVDERRLVQAERSWV